MARAAVALAALLAVAGCASGIGTATNAPARSAGPGSAAGTTGPAAPVGSRTTAEPDPDDLVTDHRPCAQWAEPTKYGPPPERLLMDERTNVVRTDRSDDEAWAAVRREMLAAAGRVTNGPVPVYRFVDRDRLQGLDPSELYAEDTDDYAGRYLVFVADERTMRDPGHPLLAVLLLADPRRPHRVEAAAAADFQQRWDFDRLTGDMSVDDRVCELEAVSGPDGVYRG